MIFLILMGMQGKKYPRRNVNGVLLLDKPAGMTSNAVLQYVKRLFGAKKTGHTGSLDKMATGLLPLCFGEATKFSGMLLDSSKHYFATCSLGVKTRTGDATGDIVDVREVPELSREKIEAILARYKGEISQVPPMFSALKRNGHKLYKLAYQGIEVERSPRAVHIYDLNLRDFSHDQIDVEVRCSKGTYIRTLAEDIGEAVGCGAHISALRRTGVGPFTEEQMISLSKLETLAEISFEALDKILLPIDCAMRQLASVELEDDVVYYLRQGQPVLVPHAPIKGLVRIYDQRDRFLGIGEVRDDGRIAPRRLVQINV